MKFFISLFLRNIPRKYLQLFSHVVMKIFAIFYAGDKVQCPVCYHTYRKFAPYGRVARSNALCPNCLSLERHRLLWLYLKSKTNFFSAKSKMLHVAPELCYIERFEALPDIDYITADIESPLAKVKMDIHDIPFVDNTFDVAMCNHVMEHVEDDIQAMRELYRTLKPGGWAIIQIPFFYPLAEETYEDKSVIGAKEREAAFGQDDHVRLYGKDYGRRLEKAGFKVVEDEYVKSLGAEIVAKHALPAEEIIYLCKKS